MVYKVYNVYEVNDYIKSDIGEKEGGLRDMSVKTTQRGLRDDWTRATFILRKSHLKELKVLAY
jgi:hypothetical protein